MNICAFVGVLIKYTVPRYMHTLLYNQLSGYQENFTPVSERNLKLNHESRQENFHKNLPCICVFNRYRYTTQFCIQTTINNVSLGKGGGVVLA